MNKTVLWLIVKRLLYSFFLLFLLSSFIFLLLRISPGDPAARYLSPELNSALAENVRESFGLNKPVGEQYLSFITESIKGNLGVSFNYRMPVTEVIARFLPFTIFLALISFILQMVFSITLSLYAAGKKGTRSDRYISRMNLMVYALPSFLTGVLLIFIFSELLNILPSSGLQSFNLSGANLVERLFDYGKHLVLPVMTLTLTGTAVLYWYLRENMDEAFNSDYVLYLRSNGIAGKEIIRRHVLPNAVSPLISVAGIELGILLSGALITEVIFGLPGMGRLTVQAILMRDYPLVTGCALVSGTLIIASNFFADIFKYKLDKRLLTKGILD